MQPERDLLRELLRAASALGARLFRNQIGAYRLARPQCIECQRFGRVLTSGLCVGSSDLVGWVPVVIGPEHLGRTLAVFCGVEAKRADGRLSEPQRAFLAALERDGAVSGVARSVADLHDIIRR